MWSSIIGRRSSSSRMAINSTSRSTIRRCSPFGTRPSWRTAASASGPRRTMSRASISSRSRRFPGQRIPDAVPHETTVLRPTPLKGMSERLIISHYENNYGGAVKRLNLIDEQLAALDFANAAGFLINGLKREQLIAMNSMILHELFFDGLGDQSEPAPALRDAIARDFGSFDRWRSEFVAMGKALGGGSGWVLLSWSPRDRKLVNQWASDHCHTLAGGTPILALDMYEHSYHIDFGAKAATYVETFMDAVHWKNVDRLFAGVTKP